MNLHSKGYLYKPLTIFLVVWGILNLIQAGLTPLNNDEAYYWMYSKNLAWGYFDHPPMIAFMIWIGDFLFRNELGVRIMVVISQGAGILMIWSLTDEFQRGKKQNILLFIALIAILPVFNIFGFIATPDSPLLFFAALFLLIYKRFLYRENWINAIYLGFSMAGLMYSKYHGALIIIFVVLSNLILLKSFRFYMASLLGAILFLPHIIWQYSNDFPSLRYHLIERVSAFNFGHVPEYLMNMLVLHNPLILPVCIWFILKIGAKDRFDKALYFIVFGVFLFFLAASFRYHIEPQWTVLISIPMVIIIFNNFDYKKWIGSYIKWITIFMLPLFMFARSAFIIDFLPVSFLKSEYHNNKKRAEDISNLAADRPVVFTNSYQDPSEYTFYTGKFAHSLNNLNYRKTQYDLWNFEEKIHGKEVLYVPHWLTTIYKKNLTKHILPNGDSVFVRVFRNFQSLQRECVFLSQDRYEFSENDLNNIVLKIFNPYPFQINLDHEELPVVFQIAFLKDGIVAAKKNLIFSTKITTLNVGDTISAECTFHLEELPPGIDKFGICSETGILYDVFNSKLKEVSFTEKK